jgi:hypothetical protein
MFFLVPETPESPAETTSEETSLTSLILKQFEYYFSDVNLVNDDIQVQHGCTGLGSNYLDCKLYLELKN